MQELNPEKVLFLLQLVQFLLFLRVKPMHFRLLPENPMRLNRLVKLEWYPETVLFRKEVSRLRFLPVMQAQLPPMKHLLMVRSRQNRVQIQLLL